MSLFSFWKAFERLLRCAFFGGLQVIDTRLTGGRLRELAKPTLNWRPRCWSYLLSTTHVHVSWQDCDIGSELIALIRHEVHCLTNIEILAAVTASALGYILSTITPYMLALVI